MRALTDDDLSVECDSRAAAGDSAEALLCPGVRGDVLNQGKRVVNLVLATDRHIEQTDFRTLARELHVQRWIGR